MTAATPRPTRPAPRPSRSASRTTCSGTSTANGWRPPSSRTTGRWTVRSTTCGTAPRRTAGRSSRRRQREAAAGAEPGSPAQLIGDLYRSFMDTDTVERLGLGPDHRAAGADRRRHRRREPVPGARAAAPGRGRRAVPDRRRQRSGRARSLRAEPLSGRASACPTSPTTPPSSTARFARRTPSSCRRCSPLAGLPDAGDKAGRIYELESQLAAGHWDRVRSRDSSQTFNPMDRAGLDALLPAQLWDAWLSGLQAAPALLEQVVVRQPDFLVTLAGLLTPDRIPAWKDWLAWQIVRSAAPFSTGRTGREELRLLRPHAVRGAAAAGAVEARGVVRRRRRGRGARPVVRGEALPAGGQAPDGPAGRQPAGGLPAEHQRAELDERGHQGTGRWTS